jgi:hypothetical protein
MTKFQNSYLVDNFAECDGCGGMFDKTELVDSIHEPYYACQDCEEDLIATTRKEDMEKLKCNHIYCADIKRGEK